MKTRTIKYRTPEGNHTMDVVIPFFDDVPESKKDESGRVYYPVTPTAASWRMYRHCSKDKKHSIEEFWNRESCPKSITRNGIELFLDEDSDAPAICAGTRMGTGLFQQTPKAFQDIMKAAHKRTPGSKLNEKF